MAAYIKRIMKANRLLDGEYVEPYAGGAAIAIELLLHEYVSRIHINDISRPVYAFWRSAIDHTEEFCRLINDTPRTVEVWDRQKEIFSRQDEYDDIALGFATFFLNRTNRSGILNGGIIGGRNQSGAWKIDARFNAPELINRITAIAGMKKRISLSRQDALSFMMAGIKRWHDNTLIYLDPPYYNKGRDLYFDFYKHDDHREIAQFVVDKVKRQKWIVSYDNVDSICDFYTGCNRITYDIGYSARSARRGSEVMFFCDELQIPPVVGAMNVIETQSLFQ